MDSEPFRSTLRMPRAAAALAVPSSGIPRTSVRPIPPLILQDRVNSGKFWVRKTHFPGLGNVILKIVKPVAEQRNSFVRTTRKVDECHLWKHPFENAGASPHLPGVEMPIDLSFLTDLFGAFSSLFSALDFFSGLSSE